MRLFRVSISAFISITSVVLGLVGTTVATAAPPTANELLLAAAPSSGGAHLAPTSTTVLRDRFDPASARFETGITEVLFAVEKIRTDIRTSKTIAPPLRMKRNGVKIELWDNLRSTFKRFAPAKG